MSQSLSVPIDGDAIINSTPAATQPNTVCLVGDTMVNSTPTATQPSVASLAAPITPSSVKNCNGRDKSSGLPHCLSNTITLKPTPHPITHYHVTFCSSLEIKVKIIMVYYLLKNKINSVESTKRMIDKKKKGCLLGGKNILLKVRATNTINISMCLKAQTKASVIILFKERNK